MLTSSANWKSTAATPKSLVLSARLEDLVALGVFDLEKQVRRLDRSQIERPQNTIARMCINWPG